MKFSIRVKPGSSRRQVGGLLGDDLIVAVTERAVDGKATEAAMKLLAQALSCKPYELRLVSGATSRTKIIEAPDAVAESLERLRGSTGESVRDANIS